MKKTLATIFKFENYIKTLKIKVGAICLLSLFLSNPAFASSELFVFDPNHTNVTWHANHFGFSTPSGKFNKVDGSVILDHNNPNRSHVEVTINTSSVVTGLGKFDNYLKGINFLNSKQFPTAKFVSNRIDVKGSKRAVIHGDFTLLGVTKPIILQARLNKIGKNPFSQKRTAGFSAAGYIKRSDFGMNFGTPGISDKIKITIEAETTFSKKINAEESQTTDNKDGKITASKSNKWTIVPDKSTITFKAKQSGAHIKGSFDKLSGTMFFNPKQLTKSSINVSVDTKSIAIAFGDSEAVKGNEWLGAYKFPKATFKSRTITGLDFNNKDFSASGMLTIKGKRVPATINFTLTKYLPDSGKATAKGYFTIKRSSFGIGHKNPKRAQGVEDAVRINFVINAKK